MPELKTFTREEVARHSSPNDTWIIIDSEGELRGSVFKIRMFCFRKTGLCSNVCMQMIYSLGSFCLC